MCKHQKFIVVHLLHLSSDPSSFSSQTWSVLSRHLANTFSPASVIGISSTQLLTQVTVQHTFHLSAAFFNRFHFFRSTFPNLPFLQGFLSHTDGSSPNRILFLLWNVKIQINTRLGSSGEAEWSAGKIASNWNKNMWKCTSGKLSDILLQNVKGSSQKFLNF